MPPDGADAGLLFLQRTIEYAETVLFPNGCSCGSTTIDFSIEAVIGPVISPNQFQPAQDVTAYVLECLNCHRRTTVPASELENFSAHAYAPSSAPGAPPLQGTCQTCGSSANRYQMVTNSKSSKLECPSCAQVHAHLGEIVDITEKATIL